MKKSLLFLFTVLCTLSIFTSCKDDEDTSWQNISADYESEKLALSLNGIALSDQKVKVEAIDPENAVITLTAPIDGVALVTIDAKLIKVNDEYTFEANSGKVALETRMPQTDGYSVAATGKISSKGILTMEVKIGDVFTQEGIFLGDLKINDGALNETVRQKVYINKAGDRLLELKINNFQFMGMQLGNLQVDSIVTLTNKGKTIFTGKGLLELPAPLGTCNLDITGSIENNILTLDIAVNLAILNVDVAFEGSKMEKDMSSEAKILEFTFASELVTVQPSIDGKDISFTISNEMTAEELAALVPTFTISAGATVDKKSGEAQNFSAPVVYTVVSEDGITTTVYNVFVAAKEKVFDFNEWTTFKSSTVDSNEEYKTPVGAFGSSNPGILSINEMVGKSLGFYEYPVIPVSGLTDQAAQLKTLYTFLQTKEGIDFNALLGGMIPYVTAGSLFTGSFETDMYNPLNSTKFGIPYNGEPTTFTGSYKYTPGKTYYNNTNKVVADKVDSCSIYAILYEALLDGNGNNIPLTGDYKREEVYIGTSSRVIMRADLTDGSEKTDWTSFSIPFKLLAGKTFDATKKYYLAIVCSSSAAGDYYMGAPGSVLCVDNFKVLSK